MIREEKLGKRNLHYSKRHRIYGNRTTMMDLDSVEYDVITRKPLAFIETKFGLIKQVMMNDPKLDVYRNIAKMAEKELPVFVLIYYPLDKDDKLLDADIDYNNLKHMQYYVIPANSRAKELIPEPKMITEAFWVNFLLWLHGQKQTAKDNNLLSKTIKKVNIPDIIYS